MELQELVERIERWKSRQQGSAPPAMPPAMDAEAFEEDPVEEQLAENYGSMEEIEAVEEIPEIDSAEAVSTVEETSEVGLDQIEDVEEVEEIEEP